MERKTPVSREKRITGTGKTIKKRKITEDEPKRPTSREKRITGTGKPLAKRK